MASFFVQIDAASWQRAIALMEHLDRATLDLSDVWEEISNQLRVDEVLTFSKAVAKAAASNAPSHARYLRRKASGAPLNGRGDRAAPGAGPLTVTGKAKIALITPQTLEIKPLGMYMGVRVRDAGGRFDGDVAHIVPLQKFYSVSKAPNLNRRNELSQLVLRHLEKAATP